jgi:hypothetical protein
MNRDEEYYFWLVYIGLYLGMYLIVFIGQLFICLLWSRLLEYCGEENRELTSLNIWLCLVPILNFFLPFFCVTKIKDTLRNEFRSRNWRDKYDFSVTLGIIAYVTNIIFWPVNCILIIAYYFDLRKYLIYFREDEEYYNYNNQQNSDSEQSDRFEYDEPSRRANRDDVERDR